MSEPIVKKAGEFFLDLVETLVISLSIFLVVYLFFMQPHQVNGESMVPNFIDGEHVLTDKISYKLGIPQRGDVIVFHAPSSANCAKGTGCDFIKRIIGLPGEKIEVKDSKVLINDSEIIEAYLPNGLKTQPGKATQNGSVSLTSNEYFVMGDNRPYSSDSRTWGPIQYEDIVGKAFFSYWPVSTMGGIEKVSY